MQGNDVAAIRKATEDLGLALQKIGGAMYEQQAPQTGGAEQPPDQGGSSGQGGDDVVEGEFKEQ